MKEQCTESNDFFKRLYKTGKLIEFDEKSKIVFISDVHRATVGMLIL